MNVPAQAAGQSVAHPARAAKPTEPLLRPAEQTATESRLDRPLRIAQLAPPFEPIPPRKYGGTERVVSVLTEELVGRGHQVTLFASGDSETAARLLPTLEEALWDSDEAAECAAASQLITLGQFERRRGEFDVVHSHLDYYGFPLARALPWPPMVTTLHGRLDLPECEMVFGEFNEVALVSISDAQRAPVPNANWVATVYHGIDLSELNFRAEHQGYLAFLGRIAPEKGLDLAVEIARRAGLPLKVAARMPLEQATDPSSQRDWAYFRDTVEPLFALPEIEYVGEVGGQQKADFLGGAAALLFPIRWPEPFGLVMAEALACGTPVLALEAGSVPEVVDQGQTGWLGQSVDDLVTAVGRLGELDRATCRATAERRFSPAAMAEAYERVYHRLIGTGPAGLATASVPPSEQEVIERTVTLIEAPG
jgi:glycosyltransferase involved in cell wall biosynthesis